MSETDRAAIRGALQHGYGDATQTVLDDRVAGNVLETLKSRGWASLQEVGALILAAGGEIRLTDAQMMHLFRGDEIEVTVQEDPITRDKVFRASVR